MRLPGRFFPRQRLTIVPARAEVGTVAQRLEARSMAPTPGVGLRTDDDGAARRTIPAQRGRSHHDPPRMLGRHGELFRHHQASRSAARRRPTSALDPTRRVSHQPNQHLDAALSRHRDIGGLEIPVRYTCVRDRRASASCGDRAHPGQQSPGRSDQGPAVDQLHEETACRRPLRWSADDVFRWLSPAAVLASFSA
jgi:hypothetical protein